MRELIGPQISLASSKGLARGGQNADVTSLPHDTERADVNCREPTTEYGGGVILYKNLCCQQVKGGLGGYFCRYCLANEKKSVPIVELGYDPWGMV